MVWGGRSLARVWVPPWWPDFVARNVFVRASRRLSASLRRHLVGLPSCIAPSLRRCRSSRSLTPITERSSAILAPPVLIGILPRRRRRSLRSALPSSFGRCRQPPSTVGSASLALAPVGAKRPARRSIRNGPMLRFLHSRFPIPSFSSPASCRFASTDILSPTGFKTRHP